MTTAQETVSRPEVELQEVDMNGQENPAEATKELYRREASPRYEEGSLPKSPKSPRSPPSSPRAKTPSRLAIKSPKLQKKEETTKKKSNSGIPLRLKSGTNTASAKNEKKMGSYRHGAPQTNLGPVINRNTLEMQFINNKKRLLQLHSELLEKQRPLLDMHKSLLRTKKQLDEMGKKVFLEEVKIVSLKTDEMKIADNETITNETIGSLKSCIESVLDSCSKVSKRCMLKRDHVVKILEDMSKSGTEIDVENFDIEMEELKREKTELEKTIETTFKENEAQISEALVNWQKTINVKTVDNEMLEKVEALEETVMRQQKAISDAEETMLNLTKKFEEKKAALEKAINELNEKNSRLEEDLKKEKRTGTENLMKTRNLRTKVTDLEARTRDAEEKHNEASKKLSQLQEQMRKKEVQWLKEKDEFKKNEELLQQKFSEKQSQLDTRLQDMERLQKNAEHQQKNFYKTIETQLEIKDQELVMIEKEKEALAAKSTQLEEQLEEMKTQLEAKEKEIEELSLKKDSVPAIEYKQEDGHWVELIEYKHKINELQGNIQEQSEQISKMQSSLKAHAQLVAALKLEKDNAVKYSSKLRGILQEARDEIEMKNKTIYKIHEKLVLKEKTCDKLKSQLKEFESDMEYGADKWQKTKCQICMSNMDSDKTMDYSDAEVGKSIKKPPKYVSESLIGMSVKKVDHIRARLDNLKKMKLPFSLGKNHPDIGNPFSNDSDQIGRPVNSRLRKQIELRGKLYQILQKHADQSCEDFINLLKISVSKGSRDSHELKPSNMNIKNDTGRSTPPNFASNIKITESFSQYVDQNVFNHIYDKLNESFMYDGDEMSY